MKNVLLKNIQNYNYGGKNQVCFILLSSSHALPKIKKKKSLSRKSDRKETRSSVIYSFYREKNRKTSWYIFPISN